MKKAANINALFTIDTEGRDFQNSESGYMKCRICQRGLAKSASSMSDITLEIHQRNDQENHNNFNA